MPGDSGRQRRPKTYAWQQGLPSKTEEDRQRAEQQTRAAAAKAKAEWAFGPDLTNLEEPTTPAEAKFAIKLARLRKKELQAEKRALAAQLADVRESWRERQAGRYSTRGMGRGLTGQIVRGSIQAKRRSERMDHAETVNEFSDRRQELDEAIRVIDLLIIRFERVAIGSRSE